MWTTPCSMVVLPIASVSAPMKKDRYIKTIFRSLMPKLKGRSKKMAIAATVGMVNPMLANADPNAKFRLLCRRFALAALSAAKPSGNNTKSAIAIPTIVLGAPAAFTPASMTGLSTSANPTTVTKESSSKKQLAAVLRLLG